MTDSDVFKVLGEEGLEKLVAAFYRRVRTDEVLGPMYEQSMRMTGETIEHAEKRLREFLVFRFGGPDRYVQERGHPRLRMRHMPFAIDPDAAKRWIALMGASMDECGIAGEMRTVMDRYFGPTAMFMVNR